MRENFYEPLLLAILASLSIFVCNAPESRSSDRPHSKDGSPSSLAQRDSGYFRLPDKVVDQGEVLRSVRLPRRGIFLALSRWGLTTLAVFDVSTKTTTPLVTKPTGELSVSSAGGRIAYLVREGFNPAKNYVEVLDLKRRKSQRIEPAEDFAILGFSLSPDGERLSYGQINLRWSRSHRVAWRTGLVDLTSHESRFFLTSEKNDFAEGAIPVPFSWSGRTGEIYVRGLLPFRGMISQGIWAVMPDGSGLRRILSEPSYTTLPRLSPDGAYMAYLATRIEALPRDYISRPGAPPGNILAVMNLSTGEQSAFAQESGGAFGPFAWSTTEKGILISYQKWLDGRFRDVAFYQIDGLASFELRKITPSPSLRIMGIAECGKGAFFWIEEDHEKASLVGTRDGAGAQTFVALPEGKIQLIGCLGG